MGEVSQLVLCGTPGRVSHFRTCLLRVAFLLLCCFTTPLFSLTEKNKMQDLARPASPCQRSGTPSPAIVALPGKESARSTTAPSLHRPSWEETTYPPPATRLGQSPPSPTGRCHRAPRTPSITCITPATSSSPEAATACPRSPGTARGPCCVPTFPAVSPRQLPTMRPRKPPGNSGPPGSDGRCSITLSQSGKRCAESGLGAFGKHLLNFVVG